MAKKIELLKISSKGEKKFEKYKVIWKQSN